MNFPRLTLIIFSIFTTAGCTTTTTKLMQTEPHINQPAQYAKARDAFNQKDYSQAAILLKPLAEQGNPDAQYALGYMYHNGLGVPRNYKLALQWMSAASAKGNKKATEALHRISVLNSETTNSDLLKEEEQQPATNTEPVTGENKISQAVKPETAPSQNNTQTKVPVKTITTPASESAPESAQTKPSGVTSASKPVPAKNPEAATLANNQKKQTTLTTDEQWIMDQPDSNFTIQLMATGSESALKQFIKDNGLHNNAIYYKTQRDGKDWFTLIQGSFESFKQVNEALKKLPPQLQAAKPWPKSIGDIKELLSK